MMADLTPYTWIDDLELATFGCAVVMGLSPDTVRERLSLVPVGDEDEAVLTYEATLELPGDDEIFQLVRHDDVTVVLAHEGYRLVDHSVAGVLSDAGTYGAFGISVNADMPLVVAREGTVIRSFDALIDPPQDQGSGVNSPLPEEAGLPFGNEWEEGQEHAASAALCLLDRLSGVSLTQDLVFGGAHATYRWPSGTPR